MTLVIENVKEEFLNDFRKVAKNANATITQKVEINAEKPNFEKVREKLKANLQKPENYAVFERLKDK